MRQILAHYLVLENKVSSTPTFTVLLPAKGRPDLVRDALVSVLDQSFRDFEVIISNNGADPNIHAAIAEKLGDPRVRYLEQPAVLAMPEHWEQISRLARGRYLTVVTDRSVLMQEALATIADAHVRGGTDAEIVTWPWYLYRNEFRLLQFFSGGLPKNQVALGSRTVLDSEALLLGSRRFSSPYPTAFPFGYNSTVSAALISAIRNNAGAAFLPLTPDFSFAYACLLSRRCLTYLNQPLVISQEPRLSNGRSAGFSDATSYLATLGIADPISHSPIKAPLVENIIAEDFLSACHRFKRLDILARLDRSDLYLKCLDEMDIKQAAGQLPPARMAELFHAIETALAQESAECQARVKAVRQGIKIRVHRTARRLLATHANPLRPLLIRLLRGGKRFESALQAAGHQEAR